MIPSAAPIGRRHRVSSDDAWPLRCADGRTFAERKANAPRHGGADHRFVGD